VDAAQKNYKAFLALRASAAEEPMAADARRRSK
jgi:hypothetical protein